MFLHKKKPALLYFFFLALIYSCTDQQKITVSETADTVSINRLKKNFDTLYENFRSTNELKYAKGAVVYADSLENFEPWLLKDTGYRKDYARIILSKAICYQDLQDFIRCRKSFEKYIHLYQEYKIENPRDLAYAQANLANIFSRYGDYKEAALLLQQSMQYYTLLNFDEYTAFAILNLSIPFKELQHYDDAEQTLKKIFGLKKLGPKRKAKACIELADIYTRQGKIPEAQTQIQQAIFFLKLMPPAPDRTDTYATFYNIDGNWQMANNNPGDALKAYRQSLDSNGIISETLRDRDFGKLFISIGKAWEKLKVWDSALHYYNRALYCVTDIDTLDKFALPGQKDIYAENTIAEALYARANCIINSGMENTTALENAVSCFKLAFETESKLLNAFSYDESRMYMQEQTRKETEKAITVCYRLHQKTKDNRWAAEAFSFAEHNKAFVLSESVKRNTAASLFLEHDTLYEKVQILRKNLSWLEIETGKQHFSGSTDTALLRSLDQSKQKTEEELLAAENSVRLKNPQYASWMNMEDTLSATGLINRTIRAGGSFIEYFSGDSAVYAFGGELNRPFRFYKLPSIVKSNTDNFLHFFTDRNLILSNPSGYANAATTLYQTLLGPYITQNSSSLLVIPDGFISYIPFDALLTGTTTSTDISSFPFLIRQRETYQAFSCRALLEQLKYKSEKAEKTVAAFAPVFAAKERGLPALLHSKEELEAIKELYPDGGFYTGTDATLGQYEKTSAHADVIHLATHAGSGNSSSMAGVEFYDSTLYLNSIYVMPLKARLVVLSGCETGTGAVNKTEGLMSLARGFSYAGTKNVIGSLWQTEDNTSAEIFKHFYSNLSDNNFSTALHKAKLAVINNASVASASPYYWSGYVYIGSPAENIKKKTGISTTLLVLISGLLLIAVLFVVRRKSKTSLVIF